MNDIKHEKKFYIKNINLLISTFMLLYHGSNVVILILNHAFTFWCCSSYTHIFRLILLSCLSIFFYLSGQ